MLGLLFSTFALAAFARILLVASGIAALPEFTNLAPWLPGLAWAFAAALLLAVFARATASQFASRATR